MNNYAVLGHPVKHSLSPRIHALFAGQTGISLSYEALEAPLDGFAEFVRDLHVQGYKGMNVTVPFKGEAWQLCNHSSKRAEAAQAVNTLIRTSDGWSGENTDGVGLLRDLQQNLKLELAGKRILLLGAGGAVRGVLSLLLSTSPARLHIANRTAKKAIQLANDFQALGPISGSGLEGPFESPYDLIINGTAASLQGARLNIADGVLAQDGACYDMMYAEKPTTFELWGRQQGAAISVNGLGMLVEQAAESFRLWHGVLPDTKDVLVRLRSS
jgi:shikimate dehydrogenase